MSVFDQIIGLLSALVVLNMAQIALMLLKKR
jgi:hypothetical protein